MTIRFSPSQQVFFDTDLNYPAGIPADAVDIPEDLHLELVQAINAGKTVRIDGEQVHLIDPPAPTLDELKAALKVAATARRRSVEAGGLALPFGARVDTASDDQDRITSTIAGMEACAIEAVDFKAASGWISLTLAEIKAVRAAVALHVQACFSAERMHHEAIDALATAEDVAGYEVETGWPA